MNPQGKQFIVTTANCKGVWLDMQREYSVHVQSSTYSVTLLFCYSVFFQYLQITSANAAYLQHSHDKSATKLCSSHDSAPLASFPGPAQLSVACSTEKRGEPGIFSHVSDITKMNERRWALGVCVFHAFEQSFATSVQSVRFCR